MCKTTYDNVNQLLLKKVPKLPQVEKTTMTEGEFIQLCLTNITKYNEMRGQCNALIKYIEEVNTK